MNNKERNIVDKFLDVYDKQSTSNVEYKRIYVKPTKGASLLGFIVSLILFIIIVGFFSFSFMYFLLFFGCLVVVIYYGLNLFTEKGFGLPRTVAVPKSESDDNKVNDGS